MNRTPPFKLRAPTKDDLNCILANWLRAVRNHDDYNYIPNDIYFKQQAAQIATLINRSAVSIIADHEDPSLILGFIIYEPLDTFVLHFVFVKEIYRKLGLAKAALSQLYPEFGRREIYLTQTDPIKLNPTPNAVRRRSAFLNGRRKYLLTYNPYLKGNL